MERMKNGISRYLEMFAELSPFFSLLRIDWILCDKDAQKETKKTMRKKMLKKSKKGGKKKKKKVGS